jgi:hypothetical protein
MNVAPKDVVERSEDVWLVASKSEAASHAPEPGPRPREQLATLAMQRGTFETIRDAEDLHHLRRTPPGAPRPRRRRRGPR